ncbi:unnamed protein product, partial [Mesorhabditis belari]|uniref:Uncharacterized protein n=1 Tax=Mesorhabditis belari TaxID=2138241 RepID=A0AAF3ENK5_9BILA
MASPFYWKFAPVSLDWAPLDSHNMPTLVYPCGRRRNFWLTALPNVTVNIRIEGLYDQQGSDYLDIWTIQWLGDGNVATLKGGQEIFISFDPKLSVAPQPGTYQLRVVTYVGGLETVLMSAVGEEASATLNCLELEPFSIRTTALCQAPTASSDSSHKKGLNRLNEMSYFL